MNAPPPPIAPAEYAARRRRLLALLDRAVAVLPTAPERLRNGDTHFLHRADSNFLYLTGFAEPDAIAVLNPRAEALFTLFVRPRDPEQEVWTGRRAGPEGAKERFGAEATFPLAALDEELPKLLAGADDLVYPLGVNETIDARMLAWFRGFQGIGKARAGQRGPSALIDPRRLLWELRLFKSPAEQALMRRAGAIAAAAHQAAWAAARPGWYEYQVAAQIERHFLHEGARGPAYPTIVGAGVNSCILHYVENSARLAAGDLVLVDAGCEYEGYSSDLTRCFPAGGRFSPEQALLYDLVLAAQEAALAVTKAHGRFHEVHEAALRTLAEGLAAERIMAGPADRLIESGDYKKVFMHRTSHWLGLDTHDVGRSAEEEVLSAEGQGARCEVRGVNAPSSVLSPQPSAPGASDPKADAANSDRHRHVPEPTGRRLQPGMVLTVEPGLYVAPGTEGVDARFWGLGIRIEDDVLITPAGHEVLTAACPKSRAAIEAAMGGR